MPRVVVITGASTGLGLSLAERFLALGDTVYGISKTKKNWPQAHKKLARFRTFILFQGDVSLETRARKCIARVYQKENRIDFLINNAGYAGRPTRIENESLPEFRNNISENLITTFLMCKYSLPLLRKQEKGWIINIASYAGKRAVPLLSAYSASKFGVVALTQGIAKENLDATGFKCVAICPGGINTKMREKLFGREDARRQQSADFVADKILEVIDGRIAVSSGDDVVIRNGQVTAVNPLPAA